MNTALVTGASGFIGVKLCRALLEDGWKVRGTSLTGQVPEEVQPFHFDLASRRLPKGMTDGVDVIFHLAGKAHVTAANWQDEEEYLPLNTAGTRKLLEAASASGVKRFVYFSSVKAMGENSRNHCLDENSPLLPKGSYAISKRLAEQLVLHGGYVPEPVVLRPAMVYGNTLKGNLPAMIRAIRAGRFPPVPEFSNRRSMVHVDDMVRAALQAATHSGAVGKAFVVSDGRTYSTRQIYVWIRESLGMSVPDWSVPLWLLRLLAGVGDGIRFVAGRRISYDSDMLEKLAGSAWYCSDRIERELGFQAQYHLKETLPEIVRYLELDR